MQRSALGFYHAGGWPWSRRLTVYNMTGNGPWRVYTKKSKRDVSLPV
jgi:hypothetical protein